MLQQLRAGYLVSQGRQSVPIYVNWCIVCLRHREAIEQQWMATCPGQRVQGARRFEASGVDYCGLFDMQTSSQRSKAVEKMNLIIFVCSSMKAAILRSGKT